MKHPKNYYIALCSCPWEDILLLGLPFDIKAHPSFGQRFFPAFESKEEAKKHYPNSEIVTVHFSHESD